MMMTSTAYSLGQSKDKAWLIAEKEKFDHELDSVDSDGRLDHKEILNWVVPSSA